MLPYVVSILGLVLGGVCVRQVSRAHVDAASLSRLLVPMLASGQLERVRWILRMGPPSVYAAMLLDILESFEEGRSRGDRGPAVEAMLVDGFERSRRERLARLRWVSWCAWSAGILGAAGLWLAYRESAGLVAYVLATVALALAALSDRLHVQIVRTAGLARTVVIPALMATMMAKEMGDEPGSTNAETTRDAPVDALAATPDSDTDVDGDPDQPWLLLAIREPGQPERQVRTRQPFIKIGKLTSSHIHIQHDADVSRMHALIEITDEGVFIVDLGSTRGTYLNGERVNHKQPLRVGDVVGMARCEIQVLDAAPTIVM